MQICRHGIHQCLTSQEAQSPERSNLKKKKIIKIAVWKKYPPLLLPLPEWPVVGRPCLAQRHDPFLLLTQSERIHCWGLWQRPQTGPPHADPPSAQASRDTKRECCLKQQHVLVSDRASSLKPSPSFCVCTFELHQLLVVLPAQCNLFSVLLQKIFVGFRHLVNSSCNLKMEKDVLELCSSCSFNKLNLQGLREVTHLLFRFIDGAPIKLWEVSNLAPQTGVIRLHGA